MTATRDIYIKVPESYLPRYRQLLDRVERFGRIAAGNDVTDMERQTRVDTVVSQLDALGHRILASEGDGCIVSGPGDHVIAMVWPFAEGSDTSACLGGQRRTVQRVWRAAEGSRTRTQATRERFESQLAGWTGRDVNHEASTPGAVCPSGVQNEALTEGLRRYVDRRASRSRVDAQIVYLDGSCARPFPLSSCSLSDDTGAEMVASYRYSLLSVRHMDLDAKVDGAWLHNYEVSQPRPAAETDEFVYSESLRQLEALYRRHNRKVIRIDLFQTGLETAVVGFYRALVEHYLQHPDSKVCVIPHYYRGGNRFDKGTPWRLA